MQRLGRYELVRALGRGGSGTVYEAVLHGPGGLCKPVALKVLHGRADGLRREARLGGLLRHRHLVDVYEVGEHDGRWFCALELCAGGSLSARLPLPPRAVVEVGVTVAEALAYAHAELGLVHLDLKPANLLLSAEGEVKIADLGVARARDSGDDGRVRGTPGYMAPEQARGGPVDARADVYALGVTLVEIATGRRPGASETVTATSVEDATTFDIDAGDVPAWLRPVIDRCLDPDPAGRWPTMSALAGALRSLRVDGRGLREIVRARAGEPVAARAATLERDAFVGREAEIERVLAALAAPGVLVLKGPAGIGKSRLAAGAARRWSERTGRPDLACDLHAARTQEELLYAVATWLDVPLGAAADAHVRQLGRALAGRGAVLLVLDGFDLLVGSASVVASLEAMAPEARILLTARASVGAAPTLDLGPLEPPDARALLVARARERGVEVADDPGLDEIASRLDGVPLALELAAGRLGVLSVRDVVERLGLALLRRGTDDRHGSLRAALDWSWELLPPAERTALAQLSVFAGAFTAEAAEEVLDLGGAPVLETLEALIDRSMLSVAGPGRYRLLAGVHAYAAEQLGADVATTERHGRSFARRGSADAIRLLSTPGGLARLRALAAELDDQLLACRRAVDRDDAAVAVATLRAAWAVLGLRGPFEPAARACDAVLGLPSLSDRERAEVWQLHGEVEWARGRGEEACAAHERALALYRGLGDVHGVASVAGHLGSRHGDQGRLAEAEALLEEALRSFDLHGDRRLHAVVLGNLASLRIRQGRMDDARAGYEGSLAVHRELGDRRAEAIALGNLGTFHLERNEPDPARACLEAALEIHRETADRRSEGVLLGNLGVLHFRCGRLDEACACHEASLRVHRELGERRVEGMVLANLGHALADQERWDEARAAFTDALAIHREVGNRRSEGLALRRLGALDRADGRLAEAKEQLEAAVALARAVGDGRSEGVALAHLALVEGDRARCEEAVALLRALGDLRDEGEVLLELAALVGADEAKSLLDRALHALRGAGDAALLARALAARAEQAMADGDPPSARALLAEAAAVAPPGHPAAGRALERAGRALA